MIGLPWWLSWSRIRLQWRRPGFNPWVWKIPCRREQLPIPVFWPGEFHGLYSPWGRKESDTNERLSLSHDCGAGHSAIWRAGQQAGDPRKSWACNLSPKAAWRQNSLFHDCFLFLLRPSTDWMNPTHIMKSKVLYPMFTGLNANLIWKISSQGHLDCCLTKYLGTVLESVSGGSVLKNLPTNSGDIGDMGSLPGLGRSPGGGNGNPCQYSCLENSMDGGAWQGYTPWGRKELDTTECAHTDTPMAEACYTES